MPDNTVLNAGSAGDTIATDDLATLNGSAVSGVKAQRVKTGFGADSDFRDVDASDKTHGLPTQSLDGAHATLGTTTGAAVTTDIAGTIQQYLRGLVKLIVAGISVFAQGSQGSLTNKSGSITTGGAAQTLAASNAARKYLFVQNIASENLWFNFTTTAVADQPSIRLMPGDSFSMEGNFISTEAVSIIGATTGSKFVAKEG